MQSAIVAAVRQTVERLPERAAVIAGESSVSYRELERRAAGVAAQVRTRASGEVVGLLIPNSVDFVVGVLGAMWAGKTVAVLPTLAPPPLLALMAAEAGLTTVITTPEFAPRITAPAAAVVVDFTAPAKPAEVPVGERTNPAAVLLYTSGTTGRPKAVALSDQNILSNAESCRVGAGFGGDEVMLAILPLFHAYGLTVTALLPLFLGGTTVVMDRFVPRAVLQTIEKHRVTCLVAVPSQYRVMAKEPTPADLSSLRLCISGAERLSDRVGEEFQARFGKQVLQGYGATEASPVISLNPRDGNRPGTVGRPLPDVRVTVREGERELPAGAEGEICVEGPNVMLGYHNRPDATAEKIVNRVLHTGDRGSLSADGYLTLSGRADDLIKVAGEKIYPAEVERAIEQLPNVEEAGVIALPDEKHGSMLLAFVQPAMGAALDDSKLRVGLREHLEAGKVPRRFVVVEQLPRTATGKVDKGALARMASN